MWPFNKKKNADQIKKEIAILKSKLDNLENQNLKTCCVYRLNDTDHDGSLVFVTNDESIVWLKSGNCYAKDNTKGSIYQKYRKSALEGTCLGEHHRVFMLNDELISVLQSSEGNHPSIAKLMFEPKGNVNFEDLILSFERLYESLSNSNIDLVLQLGYTSMSSVMRKKAIEMYSKEGFSPSDIAKKLNINTNMLEWLWYGVNEYRKKYWFDKNDK
jgi:hypothetical protein